MLSWVEHEKSFITSEPDVTLGNNIYLPPHLELHSNERLCDLWGIRLIPLKVMPNYL